MKHRLISLSLVLVAVAALVGWQVVPTTPPPLLRVVKSPTCGCCQKWVDYMKTQGFTVTVENRDNFTPLKRANGVTAELESCHTAFVDNYVIEGHVPADLVHRLLREKPAGIKGLAAPGMPMGSPGMEGSRRDAYTVFSFDAQGHSRSYAVR